MAREREKREGFGGSHGDGEGAPRGRDRGEGGRGGFDRGDRGDRGDRERRSVPLQVTLDPGMHVEKAMKILKRKLIKEGLFKELKLRRFYEKPSERRKRKRKEALKKLRKEEARQKKNPFLFG